MGIQDRDYMKQHRENVRRRSRSTEDKAEDWAAEFLARHPRFLLHLALGIGGLILMALVLSAMTGW